MKIILAIFLILILIWTAEMVLATIVIGCLGWAGWWRKREVHSKD